MVQAHADNVIGGELMTRLEAGEYLSSDEAAKRLSLTPKMVHILAHRGRLEACRVGWSYLFKRESVEAEVARRAA